MQMQGGMYVCAGNKARHPTPNLTTSLPKDPESFHSSIRNHRQLNMTEYLSGNAIGQLGAFEDVLRIRLARLFAVQ